jgi:phage terminase large subunit-like protein
LDDVSGVMAPLEWAAKAIGLYHERRADRIVAETNNGGEMVEATVRAVDPRVPFRSVWASRGKVTRRADQRALRARPSASRRFVFNARGSDVRVHGRFKRNNKGYSPDRVDALVWALPELMIEGEGGAC